jgi:hypothetical protein
MALSRAMPGPLDQREAALTNVARLLDTLRKEGRYNPCSRSHGGQDAAPPSLRKDRRVRLVGSASSRKYKFASAFEAAQDGARGFR